MMQNDSCIINGSILEGGGQIIRTSLTCSSIFKINLTINNIRGNRPKPGLQNQHLAGVKLLSEICYAQISGVNLQSVSLQFNPITINYGKFHADSKTAGSVCLIMQAVIPTLLFGAGQSTLTLLGGTDADFAPPIFYYDNIVLFYMAKMGMKISINIVKRGFYPCGGGHVNVDISPITTHISPIYAIEQGDIISMRSICFVAGSLSIQLANEMRDAMHTVIQSDHRYRQINVTHNVYKELPNKAVGNGSACMLVVETSSGCRFGFNTIGKRNYSGSDMGTNVALQFINFFDNSKGCLDSQMQDQILIFMALAKGQSKIRCSELTLHSQTCIYILETMIGVKFIIEPIETSKDVYLFCEGLGINNKNLTT